MTKKKDESPKDDGKYTLEELINSAFRNEIISALEETEDILMTIDEFIDDDEPWKASVNSKAVRTMIVATIGSLAIKFASSAEQLVDEEEDEETKDKE